MVCARHGIQKGYSIEWMEVLMLCRKGLSIQQDEAVYSMYRMDMAPLSKPGPE